MLSILIFMDRQKILWTIPILMVIPDIVFGNGNGKKLILK